MGRRKNKKRGKHGGARPGAGRPADPPPPDLPPIDEGKPPEALLTDDKRKAQEARLIGRAIRNRWPVSGAVRKAVVESAAKDLAHPDPKVRRASERNLITADRVNVQRESIEVRKENPGGNVNVNITIEATEQRTRLAGIAERLGLGNVVDAISAGDSGENSPADGGAG